MDFHQFYYSERLMHSKRHPKRNLSIEVEENRQKHFNWEDNFRNLKLVYRIWISVNFSVVNDYYIKKTAKKIFVYVVLRKLFELFFRDMNFRKLKFVYKIWTFINFSATNSQCILKRMQKGIYTLSLKNLFHLQFILPHFRFINFP